MQRCLSAADPRVELERCSCSSVVLQAAPPAALRPALHLGNCQVETAKKLLFASFFALPFMGHGTLIQLLVATVLQLVFLVLQVVMIDCLIS